METKNKEIVSLEVESRLPIIKGNFEVVKERLSQELSQYDLIVDENGIKAAKAMATQINKIKSTIKSTVKDVVGSLTDPITEFKAQGNDLVAMCDDSRQKLLSQIAKFEDEVKLVLKNELKSELQSQYTNLGVNKDFQSAKIDDLVIISNKTKTGLAKKARDAIFERALACKKHQEKVDARLLALDGICYKSGLQAPLTKEHINHFLYEEDEEAYLKKLMKLIQIEITRIDLMNERMREKATNKAVAELEIESPTPSKEKSALSKKYANFKNVDEFTATSSKRKFVVTAVFEVEVDEGLEPTLAEALKKRLAKAGFKSEPTVSVERKESIA